MAKISYPITSAYALTPQTNSSIGLYVHRPIPPESDDVPYTIEMKYNHRPDLLAYDLYGDSELYWVFMVRNLNVIRDALWDFTTGTAIFQPSMTSLKKNLGI